MGIGILLKNCPWEISCFKGPSLKTEILSSLIKDLIFPVAQTVKNLLVMQETWVWSLGWEDPLEKGTATYSSILAWRIPWTERPGGLRSVESQRVGPDWGTTATATTIKDLLDVQFQMCSVKLSFLTFLDLWNVNGLISDEKRSPQKAGLTCFESFLVLLQHGL